MAKEGVETVHIVIGVWKGCFDSCRVFRDKAKAEKAFEIIKKDYDPEEHDCQLIEEMVIK